MQEYFIELSKYFINIAMILYTLVSFYAFRYSKEYQRRGVCLAQNILMFLVQILIYVNLVLVSEDVR